MAASYAHDLSQTLRLSNQLLQHLMEQRGIEGIATSHGDILAMLFECGEVSMSDLAAYTQRDPSTITALVKKLVARELVTTKRSTTDRRSVVVEITEQGKAIRSDFEAISAELMAVWCNGIDPHDLEAMQQVLQKVRANLCAALNEGSATDTDSKHLKTRSENA